MNTDALKAAVRDVPDFPKPGILFKDITPILQDPALLRQVTDWYVEELRDRDINKLAAVDARGFLFAGGIADRLGMGVIPIRKKGKLPYHTHEESYALEYGEATLTVHTDAFEAGDRVALIDDLLATGGTSAATVRLIEKGGGTVVRAAFLVELAFLKGRDNLAGYDVTAAVVF